MADQLFANLQMQQLPPQQVKPQVEIDCFKVGFLVQEAIDKIAFLSMISKKEDNSSELAGFEINKLLNEQARLEKLYADLIKRRSRLKGIALRDDHKKVEEEIHNISKKLKESTKKLCRLFKENTNLDDDARKVKRERVDLLNMLEKFSGGLNQNNLTPVMDDVLSQLESQNKLGDFLKVEQKLKDDIKGLNSQISEENKQYEELVQEMQKNIQALKDQLRKKESETKLHYQYEEKVNETKLATIERINLQERQNLQREKENISELKTREEHVFAKICEHQRKEIDRLNKEQEEWTVSQFFA